MAALSHHVSFFRQSHLIHWHLCIFPLASESISFPMRSDSDGVRVFGGYGAATVFKLPSKIGTLKL